MTSTFAELLGATPVVPVVTLASADPAAGIASALVTGGLPVVEFTLRTDAGLDAISAAAGIDGAVAGAGSVMTVAQAEAAVMAGARFLVSPGLDPDVVQWAAANGVTHVPGVATATEVMAARALGVDVVKLFPAETLGGVAMVDALTAVWPDLRFMPTGGVTESSAPAYLDRPSVLAVGGSWPVPKDAVVAADWETITQHARRSSRMRGGRQV